MVEYTSAESRFAGELPPSIFHKMLPSTIPALAVASDEPLQHFSHNIFIGTVSHTARLTSMSATVIRKSSADMKLTVLLYSTSAGVAPELMMRLRLQYQYAKHPERCVPTTSS